MIEKLRGELSALAERHPAGIGYFGLSVKDCGLPELAVLNAFGKMLSAFGPRFLAVAMVIEGSGVMTGLMRTTFNTISMMVPGKYEAKAFNSMEKAVEFLAPRLGQPGGAAVQPAELLAAMAKLRPELPRATQPQAHP